MRETVEVLRESAPDADVPLESLVVEGGSPAETWEREQAAVEQGIRFAREELGL